MNNSFYLTKDSFKEGNSSFVRLERLVYGLNKQINLINSHSGNKILICSEVYSQWKWRGHLLGEIWQKDCELDRDLKQVLQRIMEKAVDIDSFDNSFGDTKSDQTECKGLLTLRIRPIYNPIWQVDAKEDSWYNFCLNKISRSSISSTQFIDDCKILFDNIEILDRNYSTITAIYDNFKNRILHHLHGLNRFLRIAQKDSHHRNEILTRLSLLGNYDENASTEGDATRKKDFTFRIDTYNTEICCEPHIKLCKSDNPGDSQYYFHRIYFHEGVSTLFNGKIIVGHIGEHL